MKFSTWLVFAGLWVSLVYFPLAHMVWGGGLLGEGDNGISAWLFGSEDGEALIAPIDFAGGAVVHIPAGVAALVLALVVGKRRGFPASTDRPHNLPSSCSARRFCGSAGSASTAAPPSPPTGSPGSRGSTPVSYTHLTLPTKA